jgi:hypothetical protein
MITNKRTIFSQYIRTAMTKTKLIPTLLTLSMLLSAKIAHSADPATNPNLRYYAQYTTAFGKEVTALLEVTQVSDDEDGEPCFDLFERFSPKSNGGTILPKVRVEHLQQGAQLGSNHPFTLLIEEVKEKSLDENEPAE